MELNRIVYISERCTDLDDAALRGIVAESQDRNAALGISGMLLAAGNSFIQVLEGNPLHLATLYSKISIDTRHGRVRCLLNQPADERLFGGWGMRLGKAGQTAALDRARIDPLLIRLRLGSDEESAHGALTLLREFQSQLMSEAA